MIHFSDRVYVVNEYEKWIKQERSIQIADDPLSFMAFLQELGLLDEHNIKVFTGKEVCVNNEIL